MRSIAIAALGFASTQAMWLWPADTPKQYIDDFKEWEWLPEPVDTDFPFKDQAAFFHQGNYENVLGDNKYLQGWYVAEGYLGINTVFSTGFGDTVIPDTVDELYLCYGLNVEDISSMVQSNLEFDRMAFGNTYARVHPSRYPIVRGCVAIPSDWEYVFDADDATDA